VKTLLVDPFLAVERADRGWFVLCDPGPMAIMLSALAGEPGRDCTIFIQGQGDAEPVRRVVAIPYSDKLDDALIRLIDALISLRYATGQVQFRLQLKELEEEKLL